MASSHADKPVTFALGPFGLMPFVHIDEGAGRISVIESLTRNTTYHIDQITGFRAEVRGLWRRVALHVYVDGRLDHTLKARGINTRKVAELNAALRARHAGPQTGLASELERIAALHERGVLSRPEFEAAKSSLLTR